MLIKYKGHTSKLLTELSLEFGATVDLKSSELILKYFFHKLLAESSTERKILILSHLPTYIKPFCVKFSESEKMLNNTFQFSDSNMDRFILKVLSNYISAENYSIIIDSIPEKNILKGNNSKKESSIAA